MCVQFIYLPCYFHHPIMLHDTPVFVSVTKLSQLVGCILLSDFDSLRVLCVSRPLHGSMLSVRRVPVSHTLHVHNIGHVSEDMLALYFESRKHSAGGRVNGVSVYREHGYALVEMEDPSREYNI